MSATPDATPDGGASIPTADRRRWLARLIVRMLLIWGIQVLALILLGAILPGVHVADVSAAVWAVAVVGILNALVWPALVYLVLPITVLTLGMFTLFLNGLMLLVAEQIVPGLTIDGIATYIIVALGVTLFNAIAGSVLAIDDRDSYFRAVTLRIARSRIGQRRTDKPGVLFLEIDGLSAPVLQRAMRNGYAPTLARWVGSGSHRLVEWECDLSSQTAASQAGILFGDNHDIPAFRWYDKREKRLFVSNHPADAAHLERRHSNGEGLLCHDGVSRGNMFSGDARRSLITFGTLVDRRRVSPRDFYAYFVNPYNTARAVGLLVGDLLFEIAAAWHQRRNDIRPRVSRGGAYPLVRAFTVIVLRELTTHTLVSDMFAAVRSGYATFVGYDEVAHHSGVERADTMYVLFKLDQQFAHLEQAAEQAPRPYHFVVLSDHGQSQGATFRQRYGLTLEGLVRALISEDLVTVGGEVAEEGWGNLNAFLTQAVQQETTSGRMLKQLLRNRSYDDQIILGPDRPRHQRVRARDTEPDADVVVLASGNLGLVYFTRWDHRLSSEEIFEHYPALIHGLIRHDGVGFVMSRSREQGPMAAGADGVHYLRSGTVEGVDPLRDFGPNAVRHLLRTDSFPSCPDLVINSMFDPDTGEVAAFEELVGSHGGLGGDQSRPFLLFPADWEADEELVGAESVYRVAKRWVERHTR